MADYVNMYTCLWKYSKICLKRPLKKKDKTKILMTIGSLMKVESIAECFWPVLSDYLS